MNRAYGSALRRGIAIGLALSVVAGIALALLIARGIPERRPHIVHLAETAGGVDQGPRLDTKTSRFAFAKQPTPVPDLAFLDGHGTHRTLAAFRGRPIILNVWAT